jgi:hypothetical protein
MIIVSFQDAQMMDCANNICMAEQKSEMSFGLIRLGHSCKNYKKLDDFVFGNETD